MLRAWLGSCQRWSRITARRHKPARPGLAPLKGDLSGHWSVSVNGNWHLPFKFENGDVVLVDYQAQQSAYGLWQARLAVKASKALSGIKAFKFQIA